MSVIQNRSLKSFESGARNWQRINEVSGTAAEARNHASQLRCRDARAGMDAAEILHPFKIYQRPWELIETDEDFSVFWRTFRVRAGRVMEVDATGTDAGTDAIPNADPDALYYPTTAPEIRVPEATAQFWFWLEVGTGSAVVRYGPDPTAASYTPAGGDPTASWTSTNAWSSAPTPDRAHIPIGWVDTNTNAATLQATIRQLLRGDVEQVGGSGGGMNYRGEYQETTSYAIGDVVRVRGGDHQGVYICVKPALGNTPTYPEPYDVDASDNYWEILALGIKDVNICSGGATTTAHVNTDASF